MAAPPELVTALPVMPAFGPEITLKLTLIPAPDAGTVCAVTVYVVPAGALPVGGDSVMDFTHVADTVFEMTVVKFP